MVVTPLQAFTRRGIRWVLERPLDLKAVAVAIIAEATASSIVVLKSMEALLGIPLSAFTVALVFVLTLNAVAVIAVAYALCLALVNPEYGFSKFVELSAYHMLPYPVYVALKVVAVGVLLERGIAGFAHFLLLNLPIAMYLAVMGFATATCLSSGQLRRAVLTATAILAVLGVMSAVNAFSAVLVVAKLNPILH